MDNNNSEMKNTTDSKLERVCRNDDSCEYKTRGCVFNHNNMNMCNNEKNDDSCTRTKCKFNHYLGYVKRNLKSKPMDNMDDMNTNTLDLEKVCKNDNTCLYKRKGCAFNHSSSLMCKFDKTLTERCNNNVCNYNHNSGHAKSILMAKNNSKLSTPDKCLQLSDDDLLYETLCKYDDKCKTIKSGCCFNHNTNNVLGVTMGQVQVQSLPSDLCRKEKPWNNKRCGNKKCYYNHLKWHIGNKSNVEKYKQLEKVENDVNVENDVM